MNEPPCKCFSPANHLPDCEWLLWKKAGKPELETTGAGVRKVLLSEIAIPEWRLSPGRIGLFHSLVQSIRDNGLLSPVRLKFHPNGYYEIIEGLRRIKAFQELNMTSIMAVIQ